MDPIKESYYFDTDFEKVVLYFCCTRPKFWAKIGYALDPDCMGHPLSRIIHESVRQFSKESGHGCDSTLVIIQHIKRLVYDGKVTEADLQLVSDLFDEVESFGELPSTDSIANEILPVIKRRLQGQAIQLAHDEWAKKGNFEVVQRTLEKASTLGVSEQQEGLRLGSGGMDHIDALGKVERLPTGVMELDMQLGAVNGNIGFARRQLCVWLGSSGGGKSMGLIHQAGEALRRGLFTGFVTLELARELQLARLTANLVGIHTQLILENPEDREEARRRLDIITSQIGICELAEFPAHATSVMDLFNWVQQKEDEHGKKMDLLVVDYADKLYDPRVKGNNANEYTMMRYVYESLRIQLAMEHNMWVWTASQAKNRGAKEAGKRLDMEHAADSIHKVRVSDVFITLNHNDEDQSMNLFVAKNRMGPRSRFSVGPLTTDFDRARLVPVTRELAQW